MIGGFTWEACEEITSPLIPITWAKVMNGETSKEKNNTSCIINLSSWVYEMGLISDSLPICNCRALKKLSKMVVAMATSNVELHGER